MPSMMDDGPDERFRRGGGIGCAGVFAFWVMVAVVYGLVTLVELVF